MAQFFDYSSEEDSFNAYGPRNGGRRSKTVLDILGSDRRFTRLFTGLTNNRQLKNELTNPRAEFTILAPTDEAFNKLKKELKQEPNEEELREILQYLVIPEYIESRDIRKKNALVKTSLELRSLNKHAQRIYLSEESEGKLLLNHKVQISEPDIEASNGVIHAIEEVLLPPKKLNDQINLFSKQFSIAIKAFKDTGLLDKINDQEGITVFLPTDSAFRNLGCEANNYLFSDEGKDDLKKILQLHVSKKLAYSTSITGQEGNGRGRDRDDEDDDRRKPGRGRRGDEDHGRGRRGDEDHGRGRRGDDDYGRGRRRDDDYGRGRRGGGHEDDDDYGRGRRHGGERDNYPRRGRGGYDDDDDYGRGRRRGGFEDHPRRPDRGYDDDDDYNRGYPRRRPGRGGRYEDEDDFPRRRDEDYNRPGHGRRGGWNENPSEGRHPGRGNQRRDWDSNDEDWSISSQELESQGKSSKGGNRERRGHRDWDDEDDEDWDRHGRGSHDDWDEDEDEDWGKRRRGDRHGRDRDHHESFENRVQLPTSLRNEDIEIDVVGSKKYIDININHQARVLLSDGLASNGVFHAIDNVLLPKNVNLPKLSWFNINQDCKI
ncbi:hypothetical protein K7432_008664 [Basidiobolus ranarum]|uniref:FAS1 domain-containing protein n=1 Tax=Basidiobolus ranarum TaxID=34480 RepID=A0ABR2WRG1_9FUNG